MTSQYDILHILYQLFIFICHSRQNSIFTHELCSEDQGEYKEIGVPPCISYPLKSWYGNSFHIFGYVWVESNGHP